MILKEQNIEKDYRNLGSKSFDTESRARDGLARDTPQAGLLGSKLSSSLRKVRFNDQEFVISTPISSIKYNHPGFQNNNPFYLFHNQLNYQQAKYFAKFEMTKSNVDKFLSEPLMALLIRKQSYQNTDK